MKKICILLLIWTGTFHSEVFGQDQFNFKDGKFKIAQFTDLHWIPNSANSLKTTATIQSVLKSEMPDLAILTGDIVTGDPARDGWKSIISIFENAQIPFTVTMGNHDPEHLIKDDMYDLLLKSPYYVGEKGPKDIMGMGNNVISIYNSKNDIAALLYCFDSNDYTPENNYGYYDWIHFNQIEWYRKQSSQFTQNNGSSPIPSLAFFHIPLLEYNNVIGRETTFGKNLESGVSSPTVNSGLFNAFVDMQDVMGVFAGHDHNNDYIGMEYDIALGYGRVTGDDAYGSLERGGRIIEIFEGKPQFDTWIVTPSGKEDTYYYPSGITSFDENTMTYLPARNVNPKTQGVAYTYYEDQFKMTSQITKSQKVKEGEMSNFSIKDAPIEDHFGYDFRTLIKIPKKGVYRFYTISDDGSKLFINGQEVIDNDGGHSARRREAKIALDAGFHDLRVLYFEDYMGQELEVGFSSRDIMETPLPDQILFIPEKSTSKQQ